MKLPNGYGSITKLSGNRRKPYMVRISEEVYDEEAEGMVFVRKPLGYYRTKKEALDALAEFNNEPFALFGNDITFLEAYNKWSETHTNFSKSTVGSRQAALGHCQKIHPVKMKDLTIQMLQNIIDECPNSSATKAVIKTVMHSAFEYAISQNFVKRDLSVLVTFEDTEPVIDRIIFSKNEIDILWKNFERWDIKILLILMYSGLRVNELLKNNRCNVNLEEKYIYVPKELAKNKSSIRYVPIHDKIFDLVKWFYENSEKYGKEKLIVNEKGYVVTYNNFVARNLKKINLILENEHRFHDTRHTFITVASKCKVDRLSLQLIVGHERKGTTDKVYTHMDVSDLRNEINKVIY